MKRPAPLLALLKAANEDRRRLRDQLAATRMDLLSTQARLALAEKHHRQDMEAMQKQVALLMRACPTDLREMEI